MLISYNKDKKAMWHLQVKLIVEMWHDINSLTCRNPRNRTQYTNIFVYNTWIFLLMFFFQDLKLEDSLDKGLQRNHDSKIKMKKTLKQNLVFLTFTCKDKSLDKTSAVCGQLEKALS